MNKAKIYFRVDGSQQIGLGHIVRCMALAQMLCEDFDIEFACKEIPESNIEELKTLGFAILLINSEDDLLTRLTPDMIVVLDHYDLDSNYQQTIKKIGSKLVCIDDLHEKKFFADLIINPAPNITLSDYQAQIDTQFALGLDYVLLRPAFLKKTDEIKIQQTIRTAFVCFGGSDNKNITQTTVDILKNDPRFEKVIVVVGSSYNYLNSLKRSIESDFRFFIYHSISAEMMVGLIAEAQLAIVPASGILQEVLAVGCTIISGIYVENQKYTFENFKALGAFESAGDFSQVNLVAAIDKSFKNRNLALKLIDGKSKGRLKNVFSQLAKEHLVFLRKVGETDVDKTFEWASDKAIREFSFNKEPIRYENHKKWFVNKINDENCFYYLGQLNNQIFGSIRFDIENKEAKISYLIDPLYQGTGLGTILLKKGLDFFLKESSCDVSSAWGEVLIQNQASIKVFQRLGYSAQTNSLNNFVKFEKKIPNKIRI